MRFGLTQIGIIRTPYQTKKEAPRQSWMSDLTGTVELFEEYKEGLDGIEGFSHIMLFFLFHRSTGYSLKVRPPNGGMKGVFATRSPSRPNGIGMSVVELLGRRESVLTVKGLDMLDLTPLLDIKPYVPTFDHREDAGIGWLEGKI